ncbi:MAG: hypothetical protein ABSG53_01815, partial [Thermoguttaceae bacterium]
LNPAGGDNTAFLDCVTIQMNRDAFSDPSFEAPGMAGGAYAYDPNGSPWQFSGDAGVSSNANPFTSGNPNAPDGAQVAFIQENGSVSQSLYMDPGTYCVQFYAAQRANHQSNYQELQVTLDGTNVGIITPSGSAYGSYVTSNFTVSKSGIHTISFIGLNPAGGDNTAFLDCVTIQMNRDAFSDPSFEAPGMTGGAYAYHPNGSPW